MAFCLQLLSSLSTIIIVIKHKHIGIIMSFCDRKKTIDKFVIKMSKKSHFSQSKFLSLLENLKWISLLWLWEHDVTCPAWSCASGSMNVELIHKCHNWYTLRTGLSQYSKTSDRTEETHIDQPSSAKPSSAHIPSTFLCGCSGWECTLVTRPWNKSLSSFCVWLLIWMVIY